MERQRRLESKATIILLLHCFTLLSLVLLFFLYFSTHWLGSSSSSRSSTRSSSSSAAGSPVHENGFAVENVLKEDKEMNMSFVGGEVTEEERKCDMTEGEWVADGSYPMYTDVSCPFVDEAFSCQSNGRMDSQFMKWRWQPRACSIPTFNASDLLDIIRGKRLVFVGDSINRNQWESMMCLLMGGVKDPSRVYETHGRRITKEKGSYSFMFKDFGCRVEYYLSHFLVHESKAMFRRKRVPILRIDTIDRGTSKWRGADILVFNSAHWWSHAKTKSGINYYQEGGLIHPHLNVSSAFRIALTTWSSWVDNHVDPNKTWVFFRNSSPSHFRGGQWNTGGSCKEATLPISDAPLIIYPEKNMIMEEVLKGMRTPVTLLNITALTGPRIDSHPSIYGRRKKSIATRVEDCSHWCLPGVPDTWNELLYFHLKMGRHHS